MNKNKKLKIAQIAPLWLDIPPEKYGGIERIIASLTNGLVEMGHEVTLFASPGSKTKAQNLVSVYPKALIKAGIPWSDNTWNLKNLSVAYEASAKGEFDIVHSHLDMLDLLFNKLGGDTPVVHTLHNPLIKKNSSKSKDRYNFYSDAKDYLNVAFISDKARELSKLDFKNSRIIFNGIDFDDFKFSKSKEDKFIWVARVDKYKGIENAIEAAEKTGVELTLAGRIDESQQTYFENKVKPRLTDKIKFIGELKKTEMSDFYGQAKALLYPIEWEEPFGLVVAEAMACGTPVIAYNRGSMPELIEDGKTGFVVNNLEEMVDAMKKVGELDREHIRTRTKERFGEEVMVKKYEDWYYDLLN